MFSRPVVFVIVVVAAMAAAAAGGYLATRHNASAGAVPVSASNEGLSEQPAGEALPALPRDERPTFDSVLRPEPVEEASPSAETSTKAARRESGTGPAKKATKTASASRKKAAPRVETPASTEPWAVAPPPEPAGSGGHAAVPEEPHAPPVPDARFEPVYEELYVPADSVIGLQIDSTISSADAAVEDRVEARVTRDVMAGSEVAIAAGSRVIGSVTLVEHGGKVKERGRLGMRFHTLVLPDGTRTSINTETIYRESDSAAKKSAAKIGGAAAGGAVLGAILGGKKGAVIGGTLGAAGGTAVVMAGDEQEVVIPAGTIVTARLLAPVTILVER